MKHIVDGCRIKFTEVNPDKGTETVSLAYDTLPCTRAFTEVNPDKGTETLHTFL